MIGKKTKVVFIIATLYLLVTVVTLGWIVREVQLLGNEMRNQVQVIADAIVQEQKFKELNDLVEGSKETRRSLDNFVLTEAETVNFLATIEEIGLKQGVKLEINSLQVIESEEVFNTLLIALTIAGQYERLEKMIKIFETLPYHSELRSINLSTENNKIGSQAAVTLSVSLMKS